MPNCPECGEKIADIDIFCSYCGISLTPVSADPAVVAEPSHQTDDPSMSATIVAPMPAPVEEISAPPVVMPADEPIPPPIPSPFDSAPVGDPFGNAAPVEPASEPIPEAVSETAPAESPETVSSKIESEPVGSPQVAEPADLPDAESESEARIEEETDEPVAIADAPVPQVILDLETEANAAPEPIDEVAESVDSSPETPEDLGETAEPSIEEMPPESPEFEELEPQMPESVEFESVSSDPEAVEESSVAAVVPSPDAEPDADTPDEFSGDQENSMDQDSIRTLETPAYEEPVPVPVSPVDEAPPSTKQNIGNGDTDGKRAAKLKPLDEGTVLNNRYEIVRKIGGGGMGAVYLANDRNLGDILRAVKEMVQSYIEHEQQEKAVADFKREAMILTNLEHPSIPTIFDYFFDEAEGRFYLVMKYISGGDLASRLRANPEGRLDEKTVTEWAVQIADVLDYLHRQDPVIVYRDLKPANIMIDGTSGRVMLIDFGIARSINKEEKGVTAVGTMGYAPPELFSGNVEPRSDIYSLGSTMFHLLTGADPQSNPLLIFDFQKNPRPRQINPQLSDQIEQILMRSVEYNAELRFRSASELKRTLEEHLVNLQQGKVSFGVKAAPSAVGFSEQHVFCGFCGKQIVASDVFCAFCGSQQPIAQQSFHQIPVKAGFAATAKLYVVLTNDLESAGYTLEKDDNLIGRRDPMSNIFPEVDLSKYDPQTKISRRHARIRREGTSFVLEDLGSSNGTILISAGESVRLLPHQPRMLVNGDRFRVGDTTMQFSVS